MSDNSTKGKSCPICGNVCDNKVSYCNKCGWEFKFILTADSEYAKQEKKREDILKAYIAQLSGSGKASDKFSEENVILKKKLEEANSKIRQQENSKQQIQCEVSGVILMKSRETMEESAAAIYQGNNTYGSDNNTGHHHKINLDPIVFEFAPKHFSIDTTRPKGWVLKDLVGGSLKTKGGVVPSNGVYIGAGLGLVLINDIIELKIIKF